MSIRFIAIALVILIASTAYAQDKKEIEFKTPKPRQAQIAFKVKLLKLEREYQLSVTRARENYVKQMDLLQNEATQAGNLDEAIRIRDEIINVDAIKPLAPKPKPLTGVRAATASFKGHRYLAVHMSNVDWDQARQLCKKMGGHLATIVGPEEYAFLNNLVGTHNLWVGANKIRGKWRWIDGSTINNRLWHDGGPANLKDANFIYFSGTGTIWNAKSPHKNIPGFICEWDR